MRTSSTAVGLNIRGQQNWKTAPQNFKSGIDGFRASFRLATIISSNRSYASSRQWESYPNESESQWRNEPVQVENQHTSKDRLKKIRKAFSNRLKVAAQIQAPSRKDEELKHAATDNSNEAYFVAQLRFGSCTPLIVQKQNSYVNSAQLNDQHHTRCGNHETTSANRHSSTLPVPNEINELKKRWSRKEKRARLFNLQVHYDKKNLQCL